MLIGCSLIIKDDFSPHGWKIGENKIKFKNLKKGYYCTCGTIIGRPIIDY
jgi:hypothetical protein